MMMSDDVVSSVAAMILYMSSRCFEAKTTHKVDMYDGGDDDCDDDCDCDDDQDEHDDDVERRDDFTVGRLEFFGLAVRHSLCQGA